MLEGIRREAAVAAPSEACGLLFGSDAEITDQQVTENVAENQNLAFQIDPRAHFAALRAERSGGPKIAGYWHSHPSGSAAPSATDAAMAAADGKLWVIVGGDEVTAWRAEGLGVYDQFKRIAIQILEGK